MTVEAPGIASRAPAVVAVVVTRDPGAWFDETLDALAAQDYDDLSCLVLVSGGQEDPTARVAARLPDAFVRRLDGDRGYGAAVDEVLGMVEGAAFFVLCHDDCAPAPDAVHVMVEESYRSNAGVVSPKMVRWDDPMALVHVGINADKTGALVERVLPGEIDAGQHDAVHDVFVAPGGFTLVRADLFEALGGYDPAISAMGEDLDLSWRAHVAGARIVVAPGASVRHLELVATGARTVGSGAAAGRRPHPEGGRRSSRGRHGGGGRTGSAATLQALQRRHELRAVLVCYSRFHLVRVLPQVFVLALGEAVAAALVGDRARARAVLGAWRWNLARTAEIRRRRAAVRRVRVLSDRDVRSLQVRGSARLSTYLSRLTHHGLAVAHGFRGAHEAHDGVDGTDPAAAALPPVPRAGAGALWRDLGDRGAGGAEPEAAVLTASIGTAFSEDADFDELDDLGHRSQRARARAGRRRILASGRSRLMAWLVVGAVLVVGSRDLLGTAWPAVGQYLPFPSWTGTWHQLVAAWQPAGLGSRAPASPAFGVLGVLGTAVFGRMGLLQELAVLGCVPVGAWGVSRLLRPFGAPRARFAGVLCYLALPLAYDALARGRWDGLVAYAATPWVVLQLARASGLAPYDDGQGAAGRRGWRSRPVGRMVVLGGIEALAGSFAPAMALVVVAAAVAIAGASAALGCRRGGLGVLTTAAGATVVAAVLCLPWTVATVAAGRSALSVFGLASAPAAAPGWGSLLRMAVGPIGASPLGWLLLAAALSPLVLARHARLGWAARFWAVGLAGWLLALVAAKGWAVPFAPSVDVMLAPAAVAVACGAGLGVAAFESDLAGYRFGWRQVVAAASVAAIAAGLLPTLSEAVDGRWGLPSVGYAEALPLASTSHGRAATAYRVLWLGDPAALPAGGWSIGPGLAYATSVDGIPSLADLWAPVSPGAAGAAGHDVAVAMSGETVNLGSLLARSGIRYVVVASALAPQVPGVQQAATIPPPSGLVAALSRQVDLASVSAGAGGLAEFENTALRRDLPAAGIATAPAGGKGGLLDPLGAAVELAAWVVLAAALLGRRRWLDWWWVPLSGVRRRRRRRRRRRPSTVVAIGGGSPDEPLAAGGGPPVELVLPPLPDLPLLPSADAGAGQA